MSATLKPLVSEGPPLSVDEVRRYSRHLIIPDVGMSGQRRLMNAKVLCVGAGGLGSPALMYLAAAGVGTLGIVEFDTVDESNLQRQIIHGQSDIGKSKAKSAQEKIAEINPFVNVITHEVRLDNSNVKEIFSQYDIIVDGTDNFATRYLSNKVAVAQGKPLISGALTQWEGQVTVFDAAKGTPCYRCIFPEAPAAGLAPACAEAGVIAPLPGVVGSMMALEAVKVVTGAGAALRGEMVIYDGLWSETRKIKLHPRADCPDCGALAKSAV